jgi:hypothetical protein
VSSELGMLSKLVEEFEARTCKVIAVGVGSKSSHRSFVNETQELQSCQIRFPIVIDADARIMHSMGLTRSVLAGGGGGDKCVSGCMHPYAFSNSYRRPDAKDPMKGVIPQTSL